MRRLDSRTKLAAAVFVALALGSAAHPLRAAICDGVSTAPASPLTTIRVASGFCSNDNALVCSSNATCQFCVNDHYTPCTGNAQCAAVGGTCGSAGTCTDILVKPTFVTAPPGDTHRIFIVEQDGRIRIVKDGVRLATSFLDIDPIVESSGDEEGLLGLAFSPNYATDGFFFVYYTEVGGTPNTIARYHVSGNPDVANGASAVKVLSIPHPGETNHNGGCLQFGPLDGYLYIGTGDGGSACDPPNNAQNTGELKGKLLRIDVIPPPPAPPAVQYRIPPSNPYVGPGNPLDEILSIGLRNPWRFSLDRANSDLYIGDVGQNDCEEIDYRPYASLGGENYGWDHYEGPLCPPPGCGATCAPITPRVDPVKVYASGSSGVPVCGNAAGSNCSVTGGYVYRGCKMPALAGRYFYGDYCASTISSFIMSGGVVTSEVDYTTELHPVGGFSINQITTFGEDGRGEIYVSDRGAPGEIYKIVPVLRNTEVSGKGATPFLLGPTTWTWENLTATSLMPVSFYRVYRHDGNGSGTFVCIHRSQTNSWTGGDPLVPSPGHVQSYVVTAYRSLSPAEESSPGTRSNGTPRVLSANSCP